jgi:hypothetical protein
MQNAENFLNEFEKQTIISKVKDFDIINISLGNNLFTFKPVYIFLYKHKGMIFSVKSRLTSITRMKESRLRYVIDEVKRLIREDVTSIERELFAETNHKSPQNEKIARFTSIELSSYYHMHILKNSPHYKEKAMAKRAEELAASNIHPSKIYQTLMEEHLGTEEFILTALESTDSEQLSREMCLEKTAS